MTRATNGDVVKTFCSDLVISPLLWNLRKVECAFNPIRDGMKP